ncbi:MAG: hypothetical protein FJW79_07735 [Actinobacteria bacterium]|nr:hypothetical protein [Actinomycetota bacterium]
MTGDAATWVTAGLMVLGALVFAVFWITWFRQKHDQSWLPAGYREHETPFVFADSVLALLLVAAAVLLVLEEPLGESLALVAGGMLLFLGILDAAYFWRTGMFSPEREGYANLAIVLAVLAGGIFLVVRFA